MVRDRFMDTVIPLDLLEAYSRAELSRREIGDRLQVEVSFGDLFAALLDRGLPLPRYPSHPGSLGVELIRRLAARGLKADEDIKARLIVPDTGPLIILAASQLICHARTQGLQSW